MKVVQELLGHSNAALTLNVYGHALPSMQKEAMEKWQELFEQGDEQNEQNNSEDAESKNDE